MHTDNMEGLGSVQQKVSCVYETTVLNEHPKPVKTVLKVWRFEYIYIKVLIHVQVVASERMKQKAIDNDIHTAIVTEKLDGTCVYIAQFEGKPWLWARYDRKPTKGAEKRFKKFQQQKQKQESEFDKTPSFPLEDTPEYWIPALGVKIIDGFPVPDDIGHTPGWVPVSPSSRQQCWHLSAVDLNLGLALVLRVGDDGEGLYIDCVHMSQLEGHTAELIGTNINGNPYGIGSKKFPIHILVVHGSLTVRNPPEVKMETIKSWFQQEGQVEGLVWHCTNGTLFKLHRNHVALPWPVDSPTLTKRRVSVAVDTTKYELDNNDSLIARFGKFTGHSCESLTDLTNLLMSEECDVAGSCLQEQTGSPQKMIGTQS
ncbi:RNA ligase 1-like [Ruditapes philippinarum]|uniref:RNA ligase 1-like n=1 Tax=Ruditapes philippinarum TaxID=129788 RepID=UPI00295BC198|nr:RNA ligase 1-like [Ruditapes philippinarum]